MKGTISQDGKTVVGDDGKSWTIANPDAVKGHEGHHVELKGSADCGHQPDPGQLRQNAEGRQGLDEERQLAAPINTSLLTFSPGQPIAGLVFLC